MTDSLISQAMLDAVGTELNRRVSHPVAESDLRKWAIAVYWPERPPKHLLDARIAPEEFNPFAWSVAEEAHLAEIPAPELRFMLNGGIEVDYGAPIRPGDVITAVRTLGPYSERPGRLGQMLFTRTEETWTNQHGEFVRHAVSTIIRY